MNDRARHTALAIETASWTSWTVGPWFTNGNMGLVLDEPFSDPTMRLEYECSCPTEDDIRDHLGDLTRSCVFEDLYQPDPVMTERWPSILKRCMNAQGNALAIVDPEPFGHPGEPDAMCYRVRVEGADDPRAWVAVQKPYVDAITKHAHPDRWAWWQLAASENRPASVVIWALRGPDNQAVGAVMPMLCPGSALQAETPHPEYRGEPAATNGGAPS